MQRRRLSPLARTTLEVMWRVVPPEQHLPTVFASRHGEIISTRHMLGQLVAGEALSPTEFSHSVHNSLAAQASIFRRDHSESVAVSAGDDTLACAFVEAAGLLLDAEQVLVAAYDEPLPESYLAALPEENQRWALVALLTRGEPTLRLERAERTPGSRSVHGGVATSRALAAMLAGGAGASASVRQASGAHDWLWSRDVT